MEAPKKKKDTPEKEFQRNINNLMSRTGCTRQIAEYELLQTKQKGTTRPDCVEAEKRIDLKHEIQEFIEKEYPQLSDAEKKKVAAKLFEVNRIKINICNPCV